MLRYFKLEWVQGCANVGANVGKTTWTYVRKTFPSNFNWVFFFLGAPYFIFLFDRLIFRFRKCLPRINFVKLLVGYSTRVQITTKRSNCFKYTFRLLILTYIVCSTHDLHVLNCREWWGTVVLWLHQSSVATVVSVEILIDIL